MTCFSNVIVGTVDYKIDIKPEDLQDVENFCHVPILRGCTEEALAVFSRVMNENALQPASTADEALLLYGQLISSIA